jgi:hypothetical protein
MMLRCRSVIRILTYIAVSWLFLIVLWVALPCPTHEFEDPNRYSTTVLKAGKTLTRVYE